MTTGSRTNPHNRRGQHESDNNATLSAGGRRDAGQRRSARRQPRRPRHCRTAGRRALPELDALPRGADRGAAVVRRGGRAVPRHVHQHRGRGPDHPRLRAGRAGRGLQRADRHRRHPQHHRRGGRGQQHADPDAVGSQHLRRLRQRLRRHRYPYPLRHHHQYLRGDGERVGRLHPAHPGPGRLHRHPVHHRPRRQHLPAADPAVRQPLLVPLRLVPARGPPGAVPRHLRLRPGRAHQLDGLRGHRRVLHRARRRDRRHPGLRPHGLRPPRPVAGLALPRLLALHGRHGQPRRALRQPGG